MSSIVDAIAIRKKQTSAALSLHRSASLIEIVVTSCYIRSLASIKHYSAIVVCQCLTHFHQRMHRSCHCVSDIRHHSAIIVCRCLPMSAAWHGKRSLSAIVVCKQKLGTGRVDALSMSSIIDTIGGFHSCGYRKIDGLQLKIPSKWMIGGYPHLWKPPIALRNKVLWPSLCIGALNRDSGHITSQASIRHHSALSKSAAAEIILPVRVCANYRVGLLI